MLIVKDLIIEACASELQDAFVETYGRGEPDYRRLLCDATRQALGQIASADTLYHDIEHTALVALAGQAVLKGKQSLEDSISPRDWLHLTLALLFHDIGFVRGLCRSDRGEHVATGIGDATLVWPDGKSSAILTPYHVDRSQLFLRERFGAGGLLDLDLDVICACVERTRFPVPEKPPYDNTGDLPGLARAADFIGQLADPEYLRKIPALFYEFEEIGANSRFGYRNPQQMRDRYSTFFADTVKRYIDDAERYLRVSEQGRRWLTQLYDNIAASRR